MRRFLPVHPPQPDSRKASSEAESSHLRMQLKTLLFGLGETFRVLAQPVESWLAGQLVNQLLVLFCHFFEPLTVGMQLVVPFVSAHLAA